jgi:hypothetical protein
MTSEASTASDEPADQPGAWQEDDVCPDCAFTDATLGFEYHA